MIYSEFFLILLNLSSISDCCTGTFQNSILCDLDISYSDYNHICLTNFVIFPLQVPPLLPINL